MGTRSGASAARSDEAESLIGVDAVAQAQLPFEPSQNDEAFLDAYLTRSDPHEDWSSICRKAGLNEHWFFARRREHPEFVEWFLREAHRAMKIYAPEVVRTLYNTFKSIAKRNLELEGIHDPDVTRQLVQLSKVIIGWCEPPRLDVTVRGSVSHTLEIPDAPKTRRMIFDFLLEVAGGRTCFQCGAPQVDWTALAQGLGEGEAVGAAVATSAVEVGVPMLAAEGGAM